MTEAQGRLCRRQGFLHGTAEAVGYRPIRPTETGRHPLVVVFTGRVYDGFTAKAGETLAEYKDEWLCKEDIDFGF
ncbi:hypothetical protein GCM10010269_32500 [Streptomyces humidus]|uniref:Uncharacterized protein n=1 Tax=Streptomyces humidus TaxID=52259 RepID=A0A918FWQ7_9ACTN|nr:hypothetical protein GCM10010269_32500 [Streptomyces humidus]